MKSKPLPLRLIQLCQIIFATLATLANASSVDWLTGQGVNVGGIFFPHAHFQAVYGQTSADDLEHFGAGHHDPVSDGWTIQGFELGSSLRAGKFFESFANYHLFQEADTRHWDGEFEEWFGKIANLPGGFELRAGRYFNRFGLHNSSHLHGWSYVDNHLTNARLIGDDPLTTIGVELTWNLPTPWTSVINFSLGEAQTKEHHHHHEKHRDEHRQHQTFGLEGEDARFDDTVFVANWTNQIDYNDFHQFRFGASGAWGDNQMNNTTQVYGIHFQYQWRQNGYESGGRYFRWRTEAMKRHFDYQVNHEHEATDPHPADESHEHESHLDRGSETDFGLYTAVTYGLDHGIEFGLRGEYLSSMSNASLSERYRISPNVTWYLNRARSVYLRGQYNFDHSPDFKDHHGAWLQVGFNWGGSEIR